MAQPSRKEQPGAADRDAAWRQLLGLCSEGDQGALGSLYDQSSSLIYGIALRMLADRNDAEEVTLDVYHQVWRTARTYDTARGSVASWLVTMVRNKAIDRLRARALRARNEQPMGSHTDAPSFAESPDEATLAGQRRRRILGALAALSPDQREAIELAFFSGLTHAELAERLGQPLGTVKTRIRLGMMKLREQLGEVAI